MKLEMVLLPPALTPYGYSRSPIPGYSMDVQMEKTVVINEYDELMQELKSIGYTLVPHVPFPIPRGL